MLKRKSDGIIGINVYRKETSTNKFITKDSYCPMAHKRAAFHSVTYRLCNLLLSVQDFMNEIKHIKMIANVNGFYEKWLKNIQRKSKIIICQLSLIARLKKDCKRVCFNYAAPLTNRLKVIYHNID